MLIMLEEAPFHVLLRENKSSGSHDLSSSSFLYSNYPLFDFLIVVIFQEVEKWEVF